MLKEEIKLPPQDLEAEQSVLGSLMIDKEGVLNVADTLLPEDFYKKSNSEIYQAILKLWSKNEPIDILSITSELKRTNKLKNIGGASYLTELVNSVPSASHVVHYAKIVKEKKILRDLISASQIITQDVLNSPNDLETFLDDIEQKIFSISKQSTARNFTSIKNELKSAYERIEKIHQGQGRLRGVPSGFTNLDHLLSGFQRADLTIIGARPSCGKTAFALDIGRYIGTKTDYTVGIFSLEMSKEQIIDRLISAEARVDLWKLRTGRLNDPLEYEMIQTALDRLSQTNIFIDDTPSPNIIEMRRIARRLQAEQKNLGIIIVDYLQLIRPRRDYDSTVQHVTEVSRGLKAMARELNVPVIAISQLSREIDKRDTKIPRLSDLRESGSIEQDADIVLFLHSHWRHAQEQGLDPSGQEGLTEIIISKHRNGPTGSIKVAFDKNTVSFQNIDITHENSYQ
ncbi:MAG: replicative DNA helicase [Candidatus Liptonbacteria bacterium]|nr:replicative DNA helicase [Candidatus Liptonbacteria bacterium]